ncbi:MAG: UDP-2,3-diacylglucosamine diphosphatase [Planctomycetes bacterium]|nr:UDP-2,3-diacylglucosamine diphosphatase [Planctomycetota bacterium]
MTSPIRFCSDLHLSPKDPDRQQAFVRFLDRLADDGVAECWLLGDLFDAWLGPRHLEMSDYLPVFAALRRASHAGARITFLPGNRDFLLDATFARATGTRVGKSMEELRLGGKRILCFHGDQVFNRDPSYSAYSRIARSRLVRGAFGALPGWAAKKVAGGIRGVSERKTKPFTALPPESVERLRGFIRDGYDVLLCGHVHQPQRLELSAGGRRGVCHILPDWDHGPAWVEWREGVFRNKT